MMVYLILLIFLTDFIECTPEDYSIDIGRLEVEYFDKSFIGPKIEFSFKKYNKTAYDLNVNFDLLKPIDGRKLESTSKLFVFLNHEYKFTGISLTYNVCQQWKRNIFGIKTLFQKYGNIVLCDIKIVCMNFKRDNPCENIRTVPGHYYLKDFVMDFAYYPKSIPLGNYKYETEVYELNSNKKIFHINYIGGATYKASWKKKDE